MQTNIVAQVDEKLDRAVVAIQNKLTIQFIALYYLARSRQSVLFAPP